MVQWSASVVVWSHSRLTSQCLNSYCGQENWFVVQRWSIAPEVIVMICGGQIKTVIIDNNAKLFGTQMNIFYHRHLRCDVFWTPWNSHLISLYPADTLAVTWPRTTQPDIYAETCMSDPFDIVWHRFLISQLLINRTKTCTFSWPRHTTWIVRSLNKQHCILYFVFCPFQCQ